MVTRSTPNSLTGDATTPRRPGPTRWPGIISGLWSFPWKAIGCYCFGMGNDNGELTSLRKTRYLGSHPAVSGQLEDLDVVFTRDGIVLRRKREHLGQLAWSDVTGLHAENREGIERRVTASRILLFGAWALVAKKNTILSYLVIVDKRGEWLFAVPGLSAIELRAGLTHLQRFVTPVAKRALASPVRPAITAASDPAGRLEQLGSLYARNLISEAEFLERRSSILDGI